MSMRGVHPRRIQNAEPLIRQCSRSSGRRVQLATRAGLRQVDTRHRIGVLVHELRNALGTATLAATALDIGGLSMRGTTGAVLRRSLAAMSTRMNRALDEVRTTTPANRSIFGVANLIANERGCILAVGAVSRN